MATVRQELHALQPAPCTLFPFNCNLLPTYRKQQWARLSNLPSKLLYHGLCGIYV